MEDNIASLLPSLTWRYADSQVQNKIQNQRKVQRFSYISPKILSYYLIANEVKLKNIFLIPIWMFKPKKFLPVFAGAVLIVGVVCFSLISMFAEVLMTPSLLIAVATVLMLSVTDRLIRPEPPDVLQNQAADSSSATTDVHQRSFLCFYPSCGLIWHLSSCWSSVSVDTLC